MFPILFSWGPLTLHTYGLMVAMGFLAGFTLAKRQFSVYGLPLSLLDHIVLVLMVSGILGARLFYFFADGFDLLVAAPWTFFKVWEGGLVFYGGFLAAVGALMVTARVRKFPFLVTADALVASLMLAQIFGRLGCFSAGCCYGAACELPWAVTFENSQSLAPLGMPLHPTQIYEALGLSALLVGWLFVQPLTKKTGPGLGVGYYLFGYGVLRFFIEIFRGDFRGPVFMGLHPSQWVSLGCVTVGMFILFSLIRRRGPRQTN
jgi:phosphatidylglycerol---prolipoprotein diacylglyceryl transferase